MYSEQIFCSAYKNSNERIQKMNIVKIIKAFFTTKGKQQQMDLSAAEVRQEGVFLHPTDNLGLTYFVKADKVDIIIKPGAEITENDIRILENKESLKEAAPSCESPTTEGSAFNPEDSYENRLDTDLPTYETSPQIEILSNTTPHNNIRETRPSPLSKYMTKKKCFTVMLYPDEHEKLIRLIKDNGYKKVEYVLACMESAKKTSMETNYRRLTEDRAKRHQIDLAEAKRAREEALRQQTDPE